MRNEGQQSPYRLNRAAERTFFLNTKLEPISNPEPTANSTPTTLFPPDCE